jgi:hypothetical protein
MSEILDHEADIKAAYPSDYPQIEGRRYTDKQRMEELVPVASRMAVALGHQMTEFLGNPDYPHLMSEARCTACLGRGTVDVGDGEWHELQGSALWEDCLAANRTIQ